MQTIVFCIDGIFHWVLGLFINLKEVPSPETLAQLEASVAPSQRHTLSEVRRLYGFNAAEMRRFQQAQQLIKNRR